MKSRPILMSTPMVQAILAGDKTQTRRIVKPPYDIYPNVTKHITSCEFDFHFLDGIGQYTASPYGKPGDQLWVRETFFAYGLWFSSSKGGKWFSDTTHSFDSGGHRFMDSPPEEIEKGRSSKEGWYKRPSIFMPREASRITLEITDIHVERLHDITEEDAIAEGVGHGFQMNAGWPDYLHIKSGVCELTQDTAKMSFASLWESINGLGSWDDKNPWVWVVAFKRIEA